MADSGSAAASTAQASRRSRFVAGFKKKLNSYQKSKDHDGLTRRQDDRNEVEPTDRQKAPIFGDEGRTGGLDSDPPVEVKETIRPPIITSTVEIREAVQSSKGVSTLDLVDKSASGPSVEITETSQSSEGRSIRDSILVSTSGVSTLDPVDKSASGPSVEITETSQSSEGRSIRDSTVVSTSGSSTKIEKGPPSNKGVLAANTLGPIHELWNEAYEELKKQEEKLIKDYETAFHEDPAMKLGSAVILSDSKLDRKAQMKALLTRKVEDVKKNTWKLKFGGHDVPVKDLTEPVFGIVQWVDGYISGALSANPYASLAWGGVSLLLPLILNPSKQAVSLASGLAYISDLIVRSTMRENLYERRYGSNSSDEDQNKSTSSLTMYRDTLKALYIQILKFQASSICYMSKNGAFRIGSDIIKWDNWDSSLSNVREKEEIFHQVYSIWKDTRDQEDCDALFRQHQEEMRVLISISGDVSGLRNAIEKAQSDGKRTNLLDWLSTIDPSKFYNLGLEKLQSNTGDWLLDRNPKFKNWQTSHNSVAWLNGKAGSGKSVLSSSIIKYLKGRNDSNPETALAFFYFSFTDEKTQNVIEMLCSLIKQICCRRPNTPQSIGLLVDYKEKGHRPDRGTLEDILIDTIRGFSTVYVVLDALDECPGENSERENLLESLNRICNRGTQNLHLLCTSRRLTDIEEMLEPLATVDIDLSVHKEAVDHDIGLHIDETFNNAPFKSWPEHIQAEARAALIERADGMFQYVACQFDSLKPHRTPSKIQEALKDLPKGLDATYDRMLIGIKQEYRKQVASVLKWLAFSLRPLYLEELAEIFILDHEKPVPFDDKDRLFTANDVLNYLPGLVTIPIRKNRNRRKTKGKISYEIRFAHFSIKEYLSSTRIAQKFFSTPEQIAHLHISESCLAYHVHLSSSILATKNDLQKYALWGYIAQYLVHHLEKVDHKSWTTSITNRATSIIVAQSQNLLNIVRIYDPIHSGNNWEKTFDDLYSPLSYTATTGAFQLTSQLIHDGVDVNELSPNNIALQRAVYQGHEAVVKLLLENGADVNAKDGAALRAAARSERSGQEIMQLLLDNGANVNAQDGEYGTILQVAVVRGNREIIQLLLDNGADINMQGGEYGTALQAAVANYRTNREIVQLLLDNGADINIQGGYYGTALHAAAYYGGTSIMQLLLDNGADINMQGGKYGTALQAAAANSREEIIQLLLDNGADINMQGGEYGTALQVAVVENSREIVQLLLDIGADVNIQGGYYGTALQAAATVNSGQIVQLLLDNGADINIKGGEYGNALQAAVTHYGANQEIVELLLDNGADVNMQGGYYGTALQAAAYYGGTSIIQLLLENGADINIKGGTYGNALQAAVVEDELDIAELLAAGGAGFDPPGKEWDELLRQVEEKEGIQEAGRLREYQKNADGYVNRRRQELKEIRGASSSSSSGDETD